jgi:hypothetical protein
VQGVEAGAFVLAAVLSALYLMQERQLRLREFGRLFQRLPSLNALDSATFHLVSVGFITYTVAILLGVTSAFRGESFGWPLPPRVDEPLGLEVRLGDWVCVGESVGLGVCVPLGLTDCEVLCETDGVPVELQVRLWEPLTVGDGVAVGLGLCVVLCVGVDVADGDCV